MFVVACIDASLVASTQDKQLGGFGFSTSYIAKFRNGHNHAGYIDECYLVL